MGNVLALFEPNTDALPRLGDRFMIRRLSVTDLPEFQGYRYDPELGRFQAWSVMSDDEATAFLSELSVAPLFDPGSWTQIGIANASNGRLIGDVGVFLDRDGCFAEVGFTLAPHAQGRGIATAAVREAIRLVFSMTKVDRVIGVTDARNSASIRLLERLGMRRTKTMNTVFRGEPCIEHVYVLMRD